MTTLSLNTTFVGRYKLCWTSVATSLSGAGGETRPDFLKALALYVGSEAALPED